MNIVGVQLALAPQGTLQVGGVLACPKCSRSIGQGAWFCVNCGQVLVNDTTGLKEIQKKLQFQQQRDRELMPEIAHLVKPDEFIYFLLHAKRNRYCVVTERKLILFNVFSRLWAHIGASLPTGSEPKHVDGGNVLETSWGEVVSIGQMVYSGGVVFVFKVQTFKGDIQIKFIGGQNCRTIHRNIMIALNHHNTQRRDPRALICSLKL